MPKKISTADLAARFRITSGKHFRQKDHDPADPWKCHSKDAEALLAILRRYLAELRDTGVIAFSGDEAAIARYGAPEQAKRLGALLDSASAERFGSWQRAK